MKSICFCLVLSLISTTLFCQVVDFDWAISNGGTQLDMGIANTLDASGNLIVTGSFKDTADFDPGTAINNLVSKGSADIFLQKIDKDGNLLWVVGFGGSDNDFGYAVSTDKFDNVYLGGYFKDTVDFDPSSSTFNLASNGESDAFLLKLNKNGGMVWAKTFGGIKRDYVTAISVDANDYVYVTGLYSDTVDFDPNAGVFKLASKAYSENSFFLKLNQNGNLIWAKSIGGPGLTNCKAMITNSSGGNFYLTGAFFGTADFNPSFYDYNLTSNGSADIFISRFDQGGNLIWAKSIGGTSVDHAMSIAEDISGNAIITGRFRDTVDFDPDNSISNLISNNRSYDTYVLKLNAIGKLIWARSVGNKWPDIGNLIQVDNSENIYIVGDFNDTVDFDPGFKTYNLISNNQSQDVFILKLNKNGEFRWAKSVGSNKYDNGFALTVNLMGDIYVSGRYADTIDFKPDTNLNNLISKGGYDIFTLKLHDNLVGITEHTLDDIRIFPNPTNGILNIQFKQRASESEISLYNLHGQKIDDWSFRDTQKMKLNIKNKSGMYILSVETNGGVQSKLIFKE